MSIGTVLRICRCLAGSSAEPLQHIDLGMEYSLISVMLQTYALDGNIFAVQSNLKGSALGCKTHCKETKTYRVQELVEVVRVGVDLFLCR